MDRNEIEASKTALLELLVQAGHFPRPRMIAGLRHIESEPGFYEGHDTVVLVPTRERVAAARRRQQDNHGERVRGGPGVRIVPHDEDAWDDLGALKGRAIEMVRIGEDYPRDWTAARRRGWRVESRTPSPVDVRARAVANLRLKIEGLVIPLLRAGALPNPPAWQALIADDLLDHVSVEATSQSLRAVEVARAPKKQRAAPLSPDRVRLSEVIARGVNASTAYQRVSTQAWRERVDARREDDNEWSFDIEKLRADLRRTRAAGLE
ncbi:MAG: hypothetical protein JNL08_05865 [Planctomycetes bacterium]|nr:hypothetical protein [Planctomycetota bacterium]